MQLHIVRVNKCNDKRVAIVRAFITGSHSVSQSVRTAVSHLPNIPTTGRPWSTHTTRIILNFIANFSFLLLGFILSYRHARLYIGLRVHTRMYKYVLA